jgi:hypothetical protein
MLAGCRSRTKPLFTQGRTAIGKLYQGSFTRHRLPDLTLKFSSIIRERFTPGKKGLDPTFQHRPFQHNGMLALQAADADIRAQPDDHPFIAAAGVRFFQTENISQP